MSLSSFPVFVTKSRGKLSEFERICGHPIPSEALDLTEIQDLDPATVAKDKAERAFAILKRPVFVDDTGLSIQEWNGLPGALIRWFLESVGTAGLITMAQGVTDRSALATTSIGYCDGTGSRTFTSAVAGKLALEPLGSEGFGFDPIFVPNGQTRTLGQLVSHEKDRISMRTLAFGNFLNSLERRSLSL